MRRIFILFLLMCPAICRAVTAIETDEDTIVVNTLDENFLLKKPEDMQGKASYHLELAPHPQDVGPNSSDESNPASANADYAIYKANKFYRSQDYDGAMEILFQALKRYPENTRVLNMIGSIFFKLKDYGMARKYWEESLSLDGTQAEVKKFLGELPEQP